MTPIKPTKPFKTINEEAHFWDTHDVTMSLVDPKTEITDLPPLEKEKSDAITIRLQPSIKKRLEDLARQRGINVSTLSRMWLIERINQK